MSDNLRVISNRIFKWCLSKVSKKKNCADFYLEKYELETFVKFTAIRNVSLNAAGKKKMDCFEYLVHMTQ